MGIGGLQERRLKEDMGVGLGERRKKERGLPVVALVPVPD
jgi:hypothetical protein